MEIKPRTAREKMIENHYKEKISLIEINKARIIPSWPKWTLVTDSLPNIDSQDPVIVFTEGVDFDGQQYFIVTPLELHQDSDGELSELAQAVTHWTALPL